MRLHGRACELASLVDLVSRAERSSGGVAFVEGEGGIGKTRLIAEVLAAARRQGFHVFSGRGEQLERMRPFGPLVQAFGCTRTSPDPRLADIARLVSPGPDDAGGLALAGTLEYRAAEAFVDLVEHRCADGPVALVLEDLHWADDATLVAIRVLARRVTVLPLVILATLRPVPTTPELVGLVEACVEEGGLHLRLGALAADPVHELVAEALGAPPGPRLRQQLAGAAGNPLFVTELARALVQEKQISMVAGHAEVDRVQASPTLRLTILRRLGALSPPTLELLRLAAVLGPSFSPSELATVLGRSVAALMPALDEAMGAGVLGEAGARLCFRHDLVHEALYGELPRAVREGLHRDVARALTASGASALQVAQHLLLGAAPGDAQAVASLRAAAGEAASRSPAMAAELLGRAVELTEGSSPGRDLVLAERIVALLWSGRVGEAEALAAQVLARPYDPAVEGVLRLARARALFILGRIDEGLGVLDAGQSTAALTAVEAAQVDADRSYGYAMFGRLVEAEEMAARAAEAAEVAGEDLAWCVATSAASLVAFFRGDLDRAIDLAAAAVRRAESSPSPLARRYPVHYFLAVFLLEADRFAEVDAVVSSGLAMNQHWGSTWVLPMLEWVSAARRFLTGDWDDALAAAEAGLGMAGDQGSRQGFDCARSLAGLIAAYRQGPGHGRFGVAAASEPLEVAPSGVLVGTAGVLRARAAEIGGRPDQALAILEASWRAATDAGATVDYRLLGPELVRLALAAGAAERARTVVESVEQVAARMGTAGAQGAALRCRGLLESDADALAASAASYGRAGRILERAFALEEAATALAAAGRRAEAAGALEEAVAVYDALGGSVALARARAGLPSLGVRRPARPRRPRPRQGWESLTTSEERVVALVAQGLTNIQVAEALFVSRHTVESHVSHVFAKLGLTSRTELAARAVARSTGPS